MDKVTKGRMPLPQPLGLPDLEVVPAEIADKLLAGCKAAMKAAVDVGVEHGDYSLAKQLESVIREATKE